VLRLLETLTPSQRAALVLVDLVGLSDDEAGRALGIEPGSVRTRVHRARAALRDRVEPTG
jgi:RNA polymerase sigma-70 factor (ECF subfamily)